MYTTLPHDDAVHGLIRRLGDLIDDIWEFRRRHRKPLHLITRPFPHKGSWEKYEYSDKNDKRQGRLRGGVEIKGPNTIKRWVAHLVQHCYVQFGRGTFMRQRVGIPMGESCAGRLAELYLFTYEFEFMQRIVARGRWRLARRMLYTRRYIDDTGSFNNSIFNHYKYLPDDGPPKKDDDGLDENGAYIDGIYPKQFLTLNEERPATHDSGIHEGARFLDLHITTNPRRQDYVCNVVLPHQDPRPYNSTTPRYPAIDTLLAHRQKYNVVTAQMYRFDRLCMSMRIFIRHAAGLLYTLCSKGYNQGIILSKMRVYLVTHLAKRPTNQSAETVMKHIHKHYCILVVTGGQYHAGHDPNHGHG